MLENESVSPSQVEEMQEGTVFSSDWYFHASNRILVDLNYYLESNQDPDFFYDDEQVYLFIDVDDVC
jgi:hypothetical protein